MRLPAQHLRLQTPSELDTSQEDNDTWYAEHAQRDPIRHAPIASSRQYNEYVEEYDLKFQDYHQLRQAMGRVQRCCPYIHFLQTYVYPHYTAILAVRLALAFQRWAHYMCVDLASGYTPPGILGTSRTDATCCIEGGCRGVQDSLRCFARYVSALETGSMEARMQHEHAWYERQAERLSRRVQPLMLRWTHAYKVMLRKLASLRLLTLSPLPSCHSSGSCFGDTAFRQRDQGRDMALL